MNTPIVPHPTGDLRVQSALSGAAGQIPSLRFQVTRDPAGLVHVQARSGIRPIRPVRPKKKLKPWKTVARGSTVVKIYATYSRSRSSGRAGKSGSDRRHPSPVTRHALPIPPYTICWRESSNGHRLRVMRSDPARAISFAEEKATALANGEAWKSMMGANDYASYLRARELLAQIGNPPLEIAVGIYTQCVLKLQASALAKRMECGVPGPPAAFPSLDEAVQYFIENRPAGAAPKNIPELVQEILSARKQVGARGKPVSDRWVTSLGKQLGRFAQKFTGPLHSLGASEIDAWLNSLKTKTGKETVGSQTRAHYRGAVLALVRYAKFKRYLPRAWSELDEVSAAKPEDAEINILTPEQLTKLLMVAPASLVPFIAISAFAGVRHEEMTGKKKTLLDWSNVDFEEKKIYVPKGVAKTGRDRYVPMSENLAAWLLAYALPNGRVCALKNSSNALTRAKRRAGIPTGRGQTRNSLRKSFISYRVAEGTAVAQVADEAGNSVGKIRSNYLRRAAPREAERWFGIWPMRADIIQKDFGAGFGRSKRKAV